MRLLFTLYALLSVGFALGALRVEGVTTGLCSIGASGFAIMAGAGLRGSLEGIRIQKIVGPIITALLLGIAAWLSMGISWTVAGRSYPGFAWVAIGVIVCFLCPMEDVGATDGQAKSVNDSQAAS